MALKELILKLRDDESGATAIEYGLIAVVIIAAVTSVGTQL